MSQNAVEEIERAIQTLSRLEIDQLYRWLDEHYPQPLDARLQSDLAAGTLDSAIRRALDDEANGRVRPI